jgi:hypothetical protein
LESVEHQARRLPDKKRAALLPDDLGMLFTPPEVWKGLDPFPCGLLLRRFNRLRDKRGRYRRFAFRRFVRQNTRDFRILYGGGDLGRLGKGALEAGVGNAGR